MKIAINFRAFWVSAYKQLCRSCLLLQNNMYTHSHTHTQRHTEIRINENCIFVSAIFHKTSDKLFWLCRKPTMKLVRNFVASMLCICGFETKVFQFRELEISINGLHKWRQRRRQTNPMKENALDVEKLQMAHLNLLSRSNSHSQDIINLVEKFAESHFRGTLSTGAFFGVCVCVCGCGSSSKLEKCFALILFSEYIRIHESCYDKWLRNKRTNQKWAKQTAHRVYGVSWAS